jgi:predicted ATPase/class 3 adenylate cyclase
MTEERALPTGTVTFLFTDIEGSTGLLQRLGDAFGHLLAEHHSVLRRAFQASGGIELSTEGDAFFVVFASGPDGVTCATQAQRALADHHWGEGITVQVRMGMHSGLGTLGGDDYIGIDVHRAARIASAAHGGQVLLSAATAGLIEHRLPPGVRLKELGEFALKDLEHPEHLYQLCIDGLRTDFPPPRSRDARLTNLPSSLTAFVGRDRESSEVSELLTMNRLVTLTGPGGTGKTRLSMAVGEQALAGFRDGVFIVLLAPLEDHMLVTSTIAQTLGVREQGALPVEQTLEEYLADKEMLLILDNFEQVVEAGSLVPRLLEKAPKVQVLTTSRIPLRVAGEQEYGVPPLRLPDPAEFPSVEALSHYEAVDLFVQRARSATPRFSLDDDNVAAVADICRRLDGLPLAIELAAARIRILRPEEILERLDASLSFLTSGARDLPERQRTLRNAIGWSYDLLDQPLKAFFRRLGVFVGGFDFTSAEHVTDTAELGVDVFDAVELLLDNSLLRRSVTDEGATRFRMLLTIREFALERLQAGDEELETRTRHAGWYLRYVEDAAPRFTVGPDPLDAMELEHDNVRSVLRWAIDSGHGELAMRMGSSMWRFWQLRGHLAEARRWLTEILSASLEATSGRERARAVMALGSITYWQNDFEATRRHYGEALEMLRTLDDDAGLQEALYNVGFLSLLQREPDDARGVFAESREVAERRADKKGLADTAWGLAIAALQAEDWDAAREWGAECERLYDELGDLYGKGLSQFIFYQVARYTRDLDRARELTLAYLKDVDLHDATVVSGGLEMVAEIDLLEGNFERAIRLGGAAETMNENYGGGSPPPLTDLSDVREVAGESMDEARVEELWHEGRAMSPREAVAYALKELS